MHDLKTLQPTFRNRAVMTCCMEVHEPNRHEGRRDARSADLGRVKVPTLLIVVGAEPVVLDLNRKAMARE